MNPGTLLIRADANAEIGIGHVMRCLALAQAWQDAGGDAVFCQTQSIPSLDKRLQSEGIVLVHLDAHIGSQQDAIQTMEVAHIRKAQWVVVDGYHFDAPYLEYLKGGELKLLFIDDIGNQHFADIVVNQNIDASATRYPQYDGELLLGPQYVFLRREFASWRGWTRSPVPAVRKVLVTVGGCDSHNVTETVLHALCSLKHLDLEVIVALGVHTPHMDSLLKTKSQLSADVQLRRNVSEMSDLMAWADLAISAGGGTCYELIFFQVPTILITVAENQRAVCHWLGKSRVAIDAGWFHALNSQRLAESVRALILDGELRRTLIENCQHLVDGKGTSRVVERMLSKPVTSAVRMPA
jgi:UDP-2,4-diacetamido-2,4,6-trideoxy-beta-L-altropyranose hydrolase